MTSYKTIPIPAALGERLRVIQGLQTVPATLGQYVAERAVPATDRSFIDSSRLYCDSAQSCCGVHSQHEIAMMGTTSQTHCVLDTLLLASLEGASASVRSVSPLSGEVVRIEVGSDGIIAEPRSAVMSFGLLKDEGENVFETLCPYVNAFPSDAVYRRWAEATPQAVTVVMSVAQAWDFARDLLAASAPGDGGA